MLMDKAHPSRWALTKGNNAQRSIQNGRGERWALEVKRWALNQLPIEKDANAVGLNERRPSMWHRLLADGLTIIGWNAMPLIHRRSLALLASVAIIGTSQFSTASLPPAEARRIGHKIWQNECDGTIAGLTSWNSGENFASLGIGHFIWYPEGTDGPFEESFPQLVSFIAERGKNLPLAVSTNGPRHCPWRNRSEFLKAQNSPAMAQLRHFLADTVDIQSEFLVDRLNRSLPKMLEEAPAAGRAKIRANFESLLRTSQGCYALVDYVNFKGEGVLHSERYQGEGWGLLQVLQEMRPGSSVPAEEFAQAAAAVLKRRVHNAPPTRNEQRWLAGWLKRVNSYNPS